MLPLALTSFASLIFEAITALISAASAVAALTPTPKDDGIVRKIYRVLDLFALNIGHAKED